MMTSSHRSDSAPAAKAHARNGVSFAPDWQAATAEAIRDVLCRDDVPTSPDLVVIFISSAWSDTYSQILHKVRTETGCHTLIGCSSSGVVADATCHESAPGISLMAMWLPGATLTPWYLDSIPTTWPWPQPTTPRDVHGILLFSDPYRTDAQSTLVGLRQTCPGVPMIGALASTARGDRRAWVFLNDTVYDHGAVALTLEGPYDLLVETSQGGTPVGETWTITSVNHNQIITISNRPAIDVMHATLDKLVSRGFDANDMLIGFPMDEYRDVFMREDFVARGILGTDTTTGSIMVAGIPRLGQSIQFLERDSRLASKDLHEKLRGFTHVDRPIVGALLSTCRGRGMAMFDRNDHDAAAVAAALPDVPVVGLYSNGELGPVRGVPAYNSFAVSLGLIVERPAPATTRWPDAVENR